MPIIKSRTPFTPQNPYRNERPATDKIIFLSLEGIVTEEEYFERVTDVFSAIKTKIQFISVAEDAVNTQPNSRTIEQVKTLGRNRPMQLVERIDQFKQEKEDRFQFSQYKEDEFWIIADVDDNLSSKNIDSWNYALTACDAKGYEYAISNPFFELWLLLHFDDINDDDRKWAVTEEKVYQKTQHFKERLRDCGAPLKKKSITAERYTEENIRRAVDRAKKLHFNPADRQPRYLATTVYILLEKMIAMI